MSEKEKAIKKERALIDRYGIGASISRSERIETSLSYKSNIAVVDNLIGGEILSGSMIEIHGDEASGKTLLSLEYIKDAQKKNKRVAIFDYDSNLNVDFARKIGVDMSTLEIVRIPIAEDSLYLLHQMVKSNQYGVIVIDSLPAILPRVESNSDYDKIDIRTQSKIINNFLFKIKPYLDESETLLIFTNQTRSLLNASGYRTVGGRTFKSFMDVRILLEKSKKLAYKGEIIGLRTSVSIIKNTLYKKEKLDKTYMDIVYDYGVVRKDECIA